jgi:hypothetical protein
VDCQGDFQDGSAAASSQIGADWSIDLGRRIEDRRRVEYVRRNAAEIQKIVARIPIVAYGSAAP